MLSTPDKCISCISCRERKTILQMLDNVAGRKFMDICGMNWKAP